MPIIGFLFLAFFLVFPVRAMPINAPLPASAFITWNMRDWAWGGPCPYLGRCGDGDLSYQAIHGWRLPTRAELTTLPDNFAQWFRFSGANVPDGGTAPDSGAYFNVAVGHAAACATPYFSPVHTHCDWLDGVANRWAGLGDDPYAEQLYVRQMIEVAEPLGAAILGAGLNTLACLRQRWAETGLWPPRACLVSGSADMVGHGKHT